MTYNKIKVFDSETIQNACNESLIKLKSEIDPQIFSAFLSPLAFDNFDSESNLISFAVPTNLIKNHIEKRFADRIKDSVKQNTGSEIEICFNVSESIAKTDYKIIKKCVAHRPQKEKVTGPKPLSNNNLNKNYTFESFLIGENNALPAKAAKNISESLESKNLLFIYGGVGLGKSHLLHAAGNLFLKNDPEKRVYYTSSENFTNKLVAAIKSKKIDAFKKQIRSLDMLLVDDIQFLAGKNHTQEEFFHTFNALHEKGCKIIIAADKIPNQIGGIEEKLKNRLNWGIIADIKTPERNNRIEILKYKAKLHSVKLSQDVAEFIASNINSNIRELEGALNRLIATASLKKEKITLKLAENSLFDFFTPRKQSLSIRDIKEKVARYFELRPRDLESKLRTKKISFARQIAIYLTRKHTPIPYVDIGYHFGGRDHSSIIYSVNIVDKNKQSDRQIQETIEMLEEILWKKCG